MMTSTKPRPRPLPMFEDHEISWLAEKLPYSEFYLMAVKYRQKPLTGRFRKTCAKTLRQTEEHLFGSEVVTP